jgi:leader peptidase (prepilin peptidase)/N-methyltransferase
MLPVAWAALGWLLGTVLESVALRLAGEPEPRCPGCAQAEPGPRVFGLGRAFGVAGMRCRQCGSWAIWSIAGLGPLLAAVFALLAMRWALGPELLAASGYAAVLGLVAALDLRHRLVYPLLTYPATALALVVTPLAFGQPYWSGLVGCCVLAGVFLIFHVLAALLYRNTDALGRGDIMIAGLVGAMVGLSGAGNALILGTLLGGLGALGVGLARRSRRAHFAYGPALCLGGLVALMMMPAA